MGKNTQRANKKRKDRLAEEIFPLLIAGTSLTPDQQKFFDSQKTDTTIAGISLNTFLREQSTNINLLEANPDLEVAVNEGIRSGDVPPTPLFEFQQGLDTFGQLEEQFVELNRTLLQSEADFQIEFLPIFEQARLDVETQFQEICCFASLHLC